MTLKELRESCGCTQLVMSTGLGINRRTWIRYEQGEYNLPVARLSEIASIMGVKIMDVYDAIVETEAIDAREIKRGSNGSPQKV